MKEIILSTIGIMLAASATLVTIGNLPEIDKEKIEAQTITSEAQKENMKKLELLMKE
jgi:hypothetical protein